SSRLSSTIRKSDTVARLGGDEFVIILEALATVNPIAHTAIKIIDSLRLPFLIQEQEIFVTPSIGISIYPFGDHHADDLVIEADLAMYRAKQRGRNTFEFYTQEMNSRSIARLTLETSLRHALDKKEYVLYYQPQYDSLKKQVIGMEALLRWNNASKGLVSPIEFIPILEETGLIIEVGNWVLESSIKQIAEWMAQYEQVPKVSVNISARQFDTNDLPLQIEKILKKYNVPATQLEIEVTESAIMNDLEQTSTQLNALHELGVSIALDDFGTGHSSLVYLKNYPIDTIKIDKSFINNLCCDQSNQAITRAIIAMAQALEMDILAEGVETQEQQAWLKSHQCNLIQGYLFSRPMPVENIPDLFKVAQLS
ncbi:MAG: bifunctional diguanylate cyclase/phosphodiesterase, partial [Gammaproteobacteria bacterium]|nr:bifunctional diguanylate cyclase/phosphodiesterase [Gammaproteobacteria bacterium]